MNKKRKKEKKNFIITFEVGEENKKLSECMGTTGLYLFFVRAIFLKRARMAVSFVDYDHVDLLLFPITLFFSVNWMIKKKGEKKNVAAYNAMMINLLIKRVGT